ncbi:hypothetical protein BBJ28_00010948 [Nothophytophthora sp. Chile5]|nr:hypothetical protein BBJ28_00010948 [Nothophytophthora sp. Chile5]
MGRPPLPIWKEFRTAVPAEEGKRRADMECRHCRTVVKNARPTNLLRHRVGCPGLTDDVRLRVEEADDRPAPAPAPIRQSAVAAGHSDEEETVVERPHASESRRPALGKRSRHENGDGGNLERLASQFTEKIAEVIECQRRELQLRREELEFQRESFATKMEDKRRAREEERQARREQREADRQERMDLARIENEKNLAFLKAVMESSGQQRK